MSERESRIAERVAGLLDESSIRTGLPGPFEREVMFNKIQVGDFVTIVTPHDSKVRGRAVMRGPHGWVLNLGGPHGTPGIATDSNVIALRKGRTSAAEELMKIAVEIRTEAEWEAQKYVNSIHNQNKKSFASEYMLWLMGDSGVRKNPAEDFEEFGLSYMAAQSVWMTLNNILSAKVAKKLASDKKEITRAELARMLGGRRFRLKRVGFSDLARGYAYTLEVEGVPSGAMSSAMWEANKEILGVIKNIKENYSYDGTHIL